MALIFFQEYECFLIYMRKQPIGFLLNIIFQFFCLQDSYYGYVDKFKDYMRLLTALFKMILRQATGVPSGIHGHYLKYRIEAVTLKESITGERNNEAHFNEIGK